MTLSDANFEALTSYMIRLTETVTGPITMAHCEPELQVLAEAGHPELADRLRQRMLRYIADREGKRN